MATQPLAIRYIFFLFLILIFYSYPVTLHLIKVSLNIILQGAWNADSAVVLLFLLSLLISLFSLSAPSGGDAAGPNDCKYRVEFAR